ncbi:MAG: type II toxin-antitoxin system ParD family antitoxin [Planctomycetia bacterium]|nr:type II toxin-antitoxin system ParD family antitoxin [Planctomycetia bacterium]
MPTIPIDLPDTVNQFVEAKVAQGSYRTPSEFIVAVLRASQLQDTVESKLIEAIESSNFEEVKPALWDRLRARATQTGKRDGE